VSDAQSIAGHECVMASGQFSALHVARIKAAAKNDEDFSQASVRIVGEATENK